MKIKINPRWSMRKKLIYVLSITTLSVLSPLLLYVNGGTFYHNVLNPNIDNKIHDELLLINKEIDPAIAWVIAETIVDACKYYDIDPYLAVAIVRHESGCKIKAKNRDSGALGLMQWLAKDVNISEPEAIHIKNNVWNGVKILKEGFTDDNNPKTLRDGTCKMALFYYNGVQANIDGGNQYASDVLGYYYDITHRR